jgi:GNAT superfamily N-acetyltransferase
VAASGYTFIFGRWQRDQDDIRAVRDQVFRDELGFGDGFIDEDPDEDSIHVVVYESGGRAVGTARMRSDGLIDYVAVLRPWRGNTVGGAIVSYLAHIAEVKQMPSLWSEAPSESLDFFRKNGFQDTDIETGRGDRHCRRMVRPITDSSPGASVH